MIAGNLILDHGEQLALHSQGTRLSEALPGTGDAVYHRACEAGLEGVVPKRLDSGYRCGNTMNWRKVKCYIEKEMDIVGVRRESGKPAIALMADNGRYMGGAFVTFKPDKRQELRDRVQGKVGASPKGWRRKRPNGSTRVWWGESNFSKARRSCVTHRERTFGSEAECPSKTSPAHLLANALSQRSWSV
ncbi:hypothetical protein [Mesorhizobium sp. M2A.F.Ca.ET.067.02.1.1]|uniref:hypothetical protein n=1 Tax=Mesorhizobium sp. M2A.F.Ca.ET.067.02.1.1 TaxID=2496749 RepID=UPI001FDF1733|nr:hypothetical protein [Mesorhizobium sp. M2A.F.Ca.ET.067.02.1.1]